MEDPRHEEMVAEIGRFTARQMEVTNLLAEGFSYKEIATELGISPHTVNTHVKTILRRLRMSGSRRLAALMMSIRATPIDGGIDLMSAAKDDRRLQVF